MPAAQQKYRSGESVVWERVEQSMPARRVCSFEKYVVGTSTAVVSYGFTAEGNPRRYTVNLGELSRPRGPEVNPFLPGGKLPVYEPPKPLSADAQAKELATRRHALRDALAAVHSASEAHTQAKEVHQRAEREHEQARSALLLLDQQQRQNLHDLTTALRDNQPVPEPENGLDRASVVTRVSLTEKALQRFRDELADASSTLGEARSLVRDCAKAVTAAVIDQQCAALKATLDDVLAQRQRLLALTSWWIDSSGPVNLSPASIEILTVSPDWSYRIGTSTDAPRAWKSLLDRLMTDADAEYETTPPAPATEAAA
jgi:hypothetical protein